MTDALVVALAGITALVVQAVLHARERKDLLDRLMSRDFGEYKDGQAKATPPKESSANVFRRELTKYQTPGVVSKGVDHGER